MSLARFGALLSRQVLQIDIADWTDCEPSFRELRSCEDPENVLGRNGNDRASAWCSFCVLANNSSISSPEPWFFRGLISLVASPKAYIRCPPSLSDWKYSDGTRKNWGVRKVIDRAGDTHGDTSVTTRYVFVLRRKIYIDVGNIVSIIISKRKIVEGAERNNRHCR